MSYINLVNSLAPAGFWPLDDASGDWRDASGNGYPATAYGSPTYEATGPTIRGEAQDAITIDDSTPDYGFVPEGVDDGASESTGFTVSLWIKIAVDEPTGYIMSQRYHPSYDESWNLYLDSSQRVVFYVRNDADTGFTSYTTPTTAIDDATWHHLVAWYDGTAHLSLDGGTDEGEAGGDGTGWEGASQMPLALCTGSSNVPGEASTVGGDYAHFAFWKRPLDAGERAALHTGQPRLGGAGSRMSTPRRWRSIDALRRATG